MDNYNKELRGLVAEVAAAYFSTSPVSVSEIPTVLNEIAKGLSSVSQDVMPETPFPVLSEVSQPSSTQQTDPKIETLGPARASGSEIRRSVTPNGLISFEDGQTYKTLKRHLTTRGLTPDQYRAKWGLPGDYPMVCETSSAKRSALAKQIGLGRSDASRAGKAIPKTRAKTPQPRA